MLEEEKPLGYGKKGQKAMRRPRPAGAHELYVNRGVRACVGIGCRGGRDRAVTG